jgi:hypothetical protein
MNRNGVGNEESAIERKDDESPFFFWVISCIEPLLERASRSCMEQDGVSISGWLFEHFG